MRISELSEQTGIPVPRIKYYIRENLLPRGSSEQVRRAEYDEKHVRRLRLIRALVTVGGMSVARAREVLDEFDAPRSDPTGLLDLIFGSQSEPVAVRDDAPRREASRRLDDLLSEHGWHTDADDPSRQAVIEAMATMIELGHGTMLDHLDVYASAAAQVAEADLASIGDADDLAAILERSVLGSRLGEAFLTGLRRIAHGNMASRMVETGAAPFGQDRRPPAGVDEPSAEGNHDRL